MRPGAPFTSVPHLLVLAAGFLGGCTPWQRVGSSQAPTAEQQLLQAFDPASMFRSMGRLVSTDGVNFIGDVAYFPGQGDSTLAVVGLSLNNHALSFVRDGDTYLARYRLQFEFSRSGSLPVAVNREETVRVATFNETMRIDESLLLQQVVALDPGEYTLTVKLTDPGSRSTGVARLTAAVPAFSAGSITRPVLVYGATDRTARSDSIRVVLNPRGTVAWGGDSLEVYLEAVGYSAPAELPITIRDQRDSVVLLEKLQIKGTGGVEGFTFSFAPGKIPLGALTLVSGSDTSITHRTRAIVSFSQSWIVTNFDDLLDLLRYFGQDSRISALRKAAPEDRGELWQEFLKDTDPNPATPENEALEQYFARISYVNFRFRGEGVAGWRTDRGEVYIILGEPDEILDRSQEPITRYWAWYYQSYRTTLYFQDQGGFMRFRLTPESRQAFELAKMTARLPWER